MPMFYLTSLPVFLPCGFLLVALRIAFLSFIERNRLPTFFPCRRFLILLNRLSHRPTVLAPLLKLFFFSSRLLFLPPNETSIFQAALQFSADPQLSPTSVDSNVDE